MPAVCYGGRSCTDQNSDRCVVTPVEEGAVGTVEECLAPSGMSRVLAEGWKYKGEDYVSGRSDGNFFAYCVITSQ